jgi:hypothetical protein
LVQYPLLPKLHGIALPRRRTVLLCLLVHLLVWSSAGLAQTGGGSSQPDPSSSPDRPAGPEQAQRPLLNRLGLTPTYSSMFTVNRRSKDWSQAFKWKREYQKLEADNSWDMDIQKDAARNSFQSRQGRSQTHLEYSMPSFGGWSAGSDFALKRVFNGSEFDRTVDNGTSSNLFLTSALLGNLAGRLMRVPEGSLEWKLTGSAGLKSDTDIRQIRLGGETNQLRSSDSTSATGSDRALESQMRFSRGTVFKLDTTGRYGQTSEDARTQSWDIAHPDSFKVLSANNRNSSRRVALNAAWNPNQKTQATLMGQSNRERNQFYSALIRKQDGSDGLDQRLSLEFKTTPLWGIELQTKGENGYTDQRYKTSTQGRGLRRNTVDGSAHFITGPSAGLLEGLESTTEWHWQNNRNTFQSTTDYDSRERRLRQNLRRPFGQKLVAIATAEGSLSQSFYKDRSQDRDELRWMLDGALGYRPSIRIDSRLTASWSQRQTLNIPAANSRNSNTQNSYRIGAESNLQLSPTMKVGQKYAMTADYSFYDFNESNNGLIRTTEVRTSFTSVLGKKAKLDAEHNFRFKDSGQYVRENPGAPRLYGKSAEETFQYLTVTTRYDFTSEFDIHASQRYEVRRITQVVSKKLTKTTKLLFTGGMNLNHKFSDAFSVNVQADQTRSTAEKNYWRVSASLDRQF